MSPSLCRYLSISISTSSSGQEVWTPLSEERHDRNSRGPNFSRRGGAQSSGRAIVKGLLLIKESRKRRLNFVSSIGLFVTEATQFSVIAGSILIFKSMHSRELGQIQN